jgi:hypothetical protein
MGHDAATRRTSWCEGSSLRGGLFFWGITRLKKNKRRLTIIIRQTRVRATHKQDSHGLDLEVSCCIVQRCLTCLVLRVDVGTAFQQLDDDIDVPMRGGKMKRCATLSITAAHIDASIKQDLQRW